MGIESGVTCVKQKREIKWFDQCFSSKMCTYEDYKRLSVFSILNFLFTNSFYEDIQV